MFAIINLNIVVFFIIGEKYWELPGAITAMQAGAEANRARWWFPFAIKWLAIGARPSTRKWARMALNAAMGSYHGGREVRRCIGFVESAPLLTKLTEIELGEARERLPASRSICPELL